MCLIISIPLKKEGSLLLSLISPVNSYVVVSLKSKILNINSCIFSLLEAER